MVDVRDDAEVADAGLGHGGNIARSDGGRPDDRSMGRRGVRNSGVGCYSLCRDPPTHRTSRSPGRPAVCRPAGRPSAADAGMLLVCLIWGVNFSVIKLAIAQIPAAAVHRDPVHPREPAALARAARSRGRCGCRRAACAGWSSWASSATRFYQLAFILGLAHTTATNSSLIIATVPTVVAVFAGVLGPRARHAAHVVGHRPRHARRRARDRGRAASSSQPARSTAIC